MARIDNLTNFLTDVASSIKTKLGDETDIPASQFDTKIMEIETGGSYQDKTVNVTQNGTQTITPDTNYDALSSVALNINVPVNVLQSKTYEFTNNAHVVLNPEQGCDGFSSVDLTINVSNKPTINIVNGEVSGTTLILNSKPYIELEYIESTGIQYIDTGVVPSVDTKLETNFAVTDTTILNYMGCALAGGGGWFEFGASRNGTSYVSLFSTDSEDGLKMNGDTDTNYHIYYVSNGLQKVDDNEAHNTISEFTGMMVSIYLFKRHITWEAEDRLQFTKSKMKYCKIWQGDTLIRHFIPVKRKSDNEICMYDKITNQFFINQGTGSFIAGPEIN